MGFFSWVILGAISGWLASRLSGSIERKGCFFNIFLGIVGAIIGGFVFTILGGTGVTGFNIWSILVSTTGALILIWIVQNIKR